MYQITPITVMTAILYQLIIFSVSRQPPLHFWIIQYYISLFEFYADCSNKNNTKNSCINNNYLLHYNADFPPTPKVQLMYDPLAVR